MTRKLDRLFRSKSRPCTNYLMEHGIENLPVRSNGKVWSTSLHHLTSTNSTHSPKKNPILVNHVSYHLSLLEITETIQDVFHLVAGNYSAATTTNPVGAYDVYKMDIRKGAKQAIVTTIANLPKAGLLNGVYHSPGPKGSDFNRGLWGLATLEARC